MLFQCAGRGGVRSYGLQNLKETADDNTYDFLSCRLFSLCRGRAHCFQRSRSGEIHRRKRSSRTNTPRLKEARRCRSQVRPSVCDEWRGISHGLSHRYRHRAGSQLTGPHTGCASHDTPLFYHLRIAMVPKQTKNSRMIVISIQSLVNWPIAPNLRN